MKDNQQLAAGQIRLNYSRGRSILSLSLPLLVVGDSANYNKGAYALHTVFSSGSLAWGCSRMPTHTHTHTQDAHPHTPGGAHCQASYITCSPIPSTVLHTIKVPSTHVMWTESSLITRQQMGISHTRASANHSQQ